MAEEYDIVHWQNSPLDLYLKSMGAELDAVPPPKPPIQSTNSTSGKNTFEPKFRQLYKHLSIDDSKTFQCAKLPFVYKWFLKWFNETLAHALRTFAVEFCSDDATLRSEGTSTVPSVSYKDRFEVVLGWMPNEIYFRVRLATLAAGLVLILKFLGITVFLLTTICSFGVLACRFWAHNFVSCISSLKAASVAYQSVLKECIKWAEENRTAKRAARGTFALANVSGDAEYGRLAIDDANVAFRNFIMQNAQGVMEEMVKDKLLFLVNLKVGKGQLKPQRLNLLDFYEIGNCVKGFIYSSLHFLCLLGKRLMRRFKIGEGDSDSETITAQIEGTNDRINGKCDTTDKIKIDETVTNHQEGDASLRTVLTLFDDCFAECCASIQAGLISCTQMARCENLFQLNYDKFIFFGRSENVAAEMKRQPARSNMMWGFGSAVAVFKAAWALQAYILTVDKTLQSSTVSLCFMLIRDWSTSSLPTQKTNFAKSFSCKAAAIRVDLPPCIEKIPQSRRPRPKRCNSLFDVLPGNQQTALSKVANEMGKTLAKLRLGFTISTPQNITSNSIQNDLTNSCVLDGNNVEVKNCDAVKTQKQHKDELFRLQLISRFVSETVESVESMLYETKAVSSFMEKYVLEARSQMSSSVSKGNQSTDNAENSEKFPSIASGSENGKLNCKPIKCCIDEIINPFSKTADASSAPHEFFLSTGGFEVTSKINGNNYPLQIDDFSEWSSIDAARDRNMRTTRGEIMKELLTKFAVELDPKIENCEMKVKVTNLASDCNGLPLLQESTSTMADVEFQLRNEDDAGDETSACDASKCISDQSADGRGDGLSVQEAAEFHEDARCVMSELLRSRFPRCSLAEVNLISE